MRCFCYPFYLALFLGALTFYVPVQGIDFEGEIAPILEANCLACHNASDAEGDFVLDSKQSVMEHPDAIIPGKTSESYLFDVISGPDPDMPEDGDPLSEAEVSLIKRWIKEGAAWPDGLILKDKKPRDLDWWSLTPLEQSTVPNSKKDHPVDAFVAEQLKEKKLRPVGEADSRTLIRRMSYDLTGLPPTPEALERFIHEYDSASEARRNGIWRSWIDTYLASPEFGEKWAQHWLDLARYAETHGYDKDKLRPNAWPYRDYVIRSFNEDKAYGRFVQEQVAGDVLFPGEADGIIGLGFLAAGPWDFVGHYEVGEDKLDGRIAKHLDRDEMVSAVFNVFQSTTVQCAQCHHHKFDPIKMKDYYRLHAVFAAVDRTDRIYDGLTSEQMEQRMTIVRQLNDLRIEEVANTKLDRELHARISGMQRRVAEIKEVYGSGLEPRYGYHSQLAEKADSEKWVQVDLGQPSNVKQIFLIAAYDGIDGQGEGYGFPERYRVEASDDPEFKGNLRLLLDATIQDQPNPSTDSVQIDVGPPAIRHIRVTATQLKHHPSGYLFALGELEAVSISTTTVTNFALAKKVSSLDSLEHEEHWGTGNLVDGIFFRTPSDGRVYEEMKALEAEIERIKAEILPPNIERRRTEIKDEIEALEKTLKPYESELLVYAAASNWLSTGRFFATNGIPRPIHLLSRGDLRSPGERMVPGALPLWEGISESFFDGNDYPEGDDRAELARYLTQRDNSLLWRSIANRLWQWTFGKPLAGTPNDFGRMGILPTNLELLDYLAARLREDPDQSLKSMVRFLMTSEAYRRSSEHHSRNSEIDSENRFWWRTDRRRLTAEEFRDSLLAVSGALRTEERGGPSFYDFVIEKPEHSPHYEYHLHDPNDTKSHRRTIYRFVVRSQPQPLLTTLDCADPSISVAIRDESTSALQALTQWNHVLIEAMAKKFGDRLTNEGLQSMDAVVDRAVNLALGRSPEKVEQDLLGQHYENYGAASLARVLFNLNDFTYLD
mgnify:CR=1 FL=1|tara:strand:+ start:2783 stop:5782 length:3000 start_codon:yes stop_codon:yes gene_type:complete